MLKNTIRVVTRGADGSIRTRDYANTDSLLRSHTQIGVDDCSTDLGLRGFPVFRGLIGPIPEGKNVVRYESPEVFETLTKEWTMAKSQRRSRRRSAIGSIPEPPPLMPEPEQAPTDSVVPEPKMLRRENAMSK